MKNGEHKAVLLVNAEFFEVKENGECYPTVLDEEEVKKYGFNDKFILEFSGQTKEACLKKLRKVIDELK